MGACLAAIALTVSLTISAKVSPEEADKLGTTLTPVGAEKEANADGSIPAWAPEPRRGPLAGEYPANPKLDVQKALFTINKANMAQPAAQSR